MFDKLDDLNDERLIALENLIRQKKKELQGFMTVELSINLSKWVISFGMLFCPWIEVVESLANGLISGKDYLKLLNCFQEMPMPLLKLILVMRLIQLMESI